MITQSRKWSPAVVTEATSHDFVLKTVFNNNANPVAAAHCQWCGQKIVYVALVEGTHQSTKAVISRQIGCDCLVHLLGIHWGYYSTLQQQVKTLKEQAAIEGRQKLYATKFAAEIAWLQSLPESMIGASSKSYTASFLRDMLTLLTTGKKVFTKKMYDYLSKLKKDQRFQPATVAKTAQVQNTELGKIQALLTLIESVDGKSIHDIHYRGSYNIVKSVYDYVQKMNGATRKQLDMLNKIFARYTAMSKKKIETKAVLNLNDPSIPF